MLILLLTLVMAAIGAALWLPMPGDDQQCGAEHESMPGRSVQCCLRPDHNGDHRGPGRFGITWGHKR